MRHQALWPGRRQLHSFSLCVIGADNVSKLLFVYQIIELIFNRILIMEIYETPKVEIIQVEVEKGLAVSPNSLPDYGDRYW